MTKISNKTHVEGPTKWNLSTKCLAKEPGMIVHGSITLSYYLSGFVVIWDNS